MVKSKTLPQLPKGSCSHPDLRTKGERGFCEMIPEALEGKGKGYKPCFKCFIPLFSRRKSFYPHDMSLLHVCLGVTWALGTSGWSSLRQASTGHSRYAPHHLHTKEWFGLEPQDAWSHFGKQR